VAGVITQSPQVAQATPPLELLPPEDEEPPLLLLPDEDEPPLSLEVPPPGLLSPPSSPEQEKVNAIASTKPAVNAVFVSSVLILYLHSQSGKAHLTRCKAVSRDFLDYLSYQVNIIKVYTILSKIFFIFDFFYDLKKILDKWSDFSIFCI
jgi:hypothetical protein